MVIKYGISTFSGCYKSAELIVDLMNLAKDYGSDLKESLSSQRHNKQRAKSESITDYSKFSSF